MRRLGFVFVLVLLVLAACNDGGSDPQFALVRIGVDLGPAYATLGDLTPMGIPTDPETGLSGVTEAELTVFRNSNQVFFNLDGEEVAEGASSPIILGDPASRVLKLIYGTYDFVVEAKDSAEPVPNVLADGTVQDFIVNGPDVDVTVPLVSIISTATLGGETIVLPNQIFDVFLTVHPPNRTDLAIPTSDYEAEYEVSGGTKQGYSDIGVRVAASCNEVVINADVFPAGTWDDPTTEATLTVPVSFSCPGVDGTIGVDLIPPFVEITAPLIDYQAVVDGPWITFSGNFSDQESGIYKVVLYEGVVNLGERYLDPEQEPDPYYTFTFEDWWRPTEVRTYTFTAVATDVAGNESRHSITIQGVEGP